MAIEDGNCDSGDKTQIEQYASRLYKENMELKEKIGHLEYANESIKQDYRATFTALITVAKTRDVVSHKWIKQAVDHLLKDDPDWWGHSVKE